MTFANVFEAGLSGAWRQVLRTAKTPNLLLPVVMFPLLIFAAFIGGASPISKTPGFNYYDYKAFVFVYVLLLGAGMTGVQAGVAVAQDFESGFARRMLLSTPRRMALLVTFAVSGLAQEAIVASITFLVALAAGMSIKGSPVQVLGVFALAVMFNLVGTFWASGLALRAKSTQAAAAMMLPIVLPLFFSPSLVPRQLLTSWLHKIADGNPLTPLLECGRGLMEGHAVSLIPAFAIAGGLVVLAALWTTLSLRRIQRRA